MAKFTATLTANGTATVCNARRRRDATFWTGTLFATGTFGSGTIAWQWSPDGGTTKYDILDESGAAITSTAKTSFNIQLGSSDDNIAANQVLVYAVLTGATNPSLTVGVVDNR